MAARHLYGAAAAAAAASESKFFRPSKPKDVYESMASELLKKKDVFEVVSEFPNERNADHPHPDANAFYRESRFHRRALADAPHAECTCKSECSGAMALYKCFSCAKYDPLRLGLYCANCFKKRHPWFRVEHRWVTIDRLEDVEAELKRQAQRAEIDRNLDGVERLIADVRRTSETCDVIGVDPTGDDLVKASVRKLTEVDAHVSRLQRELAQAQRARELLPRGAALAPDQFALVDYEGGGALVRPARRVAALRHRSCSKSTRRPRRRARAAAGLRAPPRARGACGARRARLRSGRAGTRASTMSTSCRASPRGSRPSPRSRTVAARCSRRARTTGAAWLRERAVEVVDAGRRRPTRRPRARPRRSTRRCAEPSGRAGRP